MRPPGDLFIILDKHKQMTRLDKGKLAEDLAKILAEEVKVSMDAEESFDGTPWAELSPAYGEWKSKHHPGQKKGELFGPLKAAVEEIPNGIRVVFDRMYLDFAANDPELRVYALAFHEGVKERNQPPRPFIGFSEFAKQRMADRIKQHLADSLEESSR